MVANISRRERFAVFGLLAAAGRAIAQATGRTRVLLVVVLLIAGLAAAWWYFGKGAREMAGPARVVDGDTLVVAGEKIRRANVASVALKSTKVRPSSTASPSICSNTGECDASKGSRR